MAAKLETHAKWNARMAIKERHMKCYKQAKFLR